MHKRLGYFSRPLTPRGVLFRSALVCGALILLLFGLCLTRIERLPIDHQEPQFEANRAYRWMSDLSKKFPGRVTWGQARKNAATWLKQQFVKMGYEPKSLMFSEVIGGQEYTDLEDIYVERIGKTHPNEIIVVMAHYDVVDTTWEGAADDGSGVGVVLELARVFSPRRSQVGNAMNETDRTVIFLLTDSEEYGAFWGSRAFVRGFEKANQIVAALNFDFVTPEKQVGILTLCDGLKSGYTPLWLREIALDSLRSFKINAMDLDGPMEAIERSMQIPPADHGPFLASGIPAFNWVGQTTHFGHVMSYYHHTLHDTVEAMKPESLDDFGKGAERVIRTIDSLSRIPENFRDSSYWKISSHYFLPGWAVTLIHILLFVPFLIYCVAKFSPHFRVSRKKWWISVLKSETKKIALVFGSFILGYAFILLLPVLKLITQYETFPATQKSFLLYHPDVLPIILVAATSGIAYVVFGKIFSEEETGSPEKVEVRHALHAAFLTFIIILAFLKNSYLAVLLLLPPAYFWSFLSSGKSSQDRILNGLLLGAGTLSFIVMSIFMSMVFYIGVYYWYIFLAAAYGLFSAYTVILFFMALTVMVRLFKSLVL